MSIFDHIEKQVKDLDEHLFKLKRIQNELVGCLAPGAIILETLEPEIAIIQLKQMLQPDYQVLGDGIEAVWLKKHQGRPVIHWNAKSFKKDDAIGSMFQLSRMPKEPKPVVIIENISEIPDAISDIYDDPVLIENVLLHSWKNDTIHLTHWQEGPFEINRQDYSIVFPVKPGDLAKLRHRLPDGIGIIRL